VAASSQGNALAYAVGATENVWCLSESKTKLCGNVCSGV
jgi:hypothetical protein